MINFFYESYKKLLNIIKQFNLIESFSEIEFLFTGFELDKDQPLDEQVKEALEWGYNNDKLEDFFLEHWDILSDLFDPELVTNLQYCKINDTGYVTSFNLSRINSKNKYYYKIDSSGVHEGIIDIYGFYSIEDKEDDENQISSFQEECMDAFTNHGEFTEEECLENGSTIEFSDGFN